MITRNKKGKAMMKVPPGAFVMPPVLVPDMEHYWVAIATSAGNLLIHHIEEAPVMPKGKGIKLINIASAKLKSREEVVTAMTVLHEDDSIKLYSGKRHKVITPEEMGDYEGERAQRGRKLPQGFRSVERIEPVVNKTEE
jgi:topoisomerase-4 subunit A